MKHTLITSCFSLFLLFSLLSCGSEEDPCFALTCLNDGTCVNGACACPEGFEGEDCSVQQIPSSMSVVGINITNYPTLRSDSSSWDSLDMTGPDIFFTFHEGTGSAYDATIDYVSATTNNTTGSSIEVNIAPPYIVTSLSTNWSLDLWDEDSAGQEEFMNSLIFLPSEKSAGLPTSFTVQKPNFSATFFVQWDF